MDFLNSLFGGQNTQLDKGIGQFNNYADFANQQGEGDTSAASKYFQGILGGDSSTVAKTLAPQIGDAKSSAQQQNKTLSQFGTRSGGTAATTAANNDKVHSDITNLIGNLTGGAASGAASLGTAQQGLAQQATGEADQTAQLRMQNWLNSILGKGITGAINYGESFLPVAHGGS